MILGLTDAAVGVIAAAGLAAFGAIAVAVINAVSLNRKVDAAATAADVAARAVGTPNSNGNVVQMSEQILANQARMALDLVDLGERKSREHGELRDHVDRLAEGLHRRLDDHERRLDRIEAPPDAGA